MQSRIQKSVFSLWIALSYFCLSAEEASASARIETDLIMKVGQDLGYTKSLGDHYGSELLSFRKTFLTADGKDDAVLSKKVMHDLVKRLRAKVTTLTTDVRTLFNQLGAFRKEHHLQSVINIQELREKSIALSKEWDSDEVGEECAVSLENSNSVSMQSKQTRWWHAWGDMLRDVTGVNFFMNMFKTNYARRDALKAALNTVYDGMVRARIGATGNHALIGLVIEKMNKATDPAIVDAINEFKNRLQRISHSIARERSIKEANDSIFDEYTTSKQGEVIMLLKIALDFFESVRGFNKTLETFWFEVKRALTQDDVGLDTKGA
jgi:hypothetical protein